MSSQMAGLAAVQTDFSFLSPQFEGRPLDLVHLSRQSLGDRALELELLSLFDCHARQIMERLEQAGPGADRQWRRDLAHALKGSARAVGAQKVVCLAESYEFSLLASGNPALAQFQLGELKLAVREACDMVQSLIAGG